MIQSNSSGSLPDFEKWVDTWFVASDECEECHVFGKDLAEYYARLFENPAFLAQKYTREQLAVGLWNICGINGSSSWHEAMNSFVPEPDRRRCVRAIGTLYTELLDPLCVSEPDGAHDSDSFCCAVYMIWDMDGISNVLTNSEFREDCISVLWTAINCKSAACIRSGLHGIGHWISMSDYRGESQLIARLRNCVDDFLVRYRQSAGASSSIIEYALQARSGSVM